MINWFYYNNSKLDTLTSFISFSSLSIQMNEIENGALFLYKTDHFYHYCVLEIIISFYIILLYSQTNTPVLDI